MSSTDYCDSFIKERRRNKLRIKQDGERLGENKLVWEKTFKWEVMNREEKRNFIHLFLILCSIYSSLSSLFTQGLWPRVRTAVSHKVSRCRNIHEERRESVWERSSISSLSEFLRRKRMATIFSLSLSLSGFIDGVRSDLVSHIIRLWSCHS